MEQAARQAMDSILVIDNADNQSSIFGDDENPSRFSSKLAQYFSRRSNGSNLLTARNKKLGVKSAGAKLTAVGSVLTIQR